MSRPILIGFVLLCTKPTDKHAALHALMVTSFPVLVFFAFLFYTDAGATFFVLLTYLLATRVDLRVRPVGIASFLPSALVGQFAGPFSRIVRASFALC
jgi:hypothetical protein